MAVAEVQTIQGRMTADEARKAAEKVRTGLDSARKALLDLHEREGWKALGYASWRECAQEEFGLSNGRVYQLLEAAEVERDISNDVDASQISTIGGKSVPERQLRELAKVKPEARKEVYEKALTATKGKPTAAAIDAIATKHPEYLRNAPSGFAVVEVTETEGETPEAIAEDHAERAAIQDEMSDEAYLESLPQRKQLTGLSRKLFELDALAYRNTEPERKALANKVSRTVPKNSKYGEYVARLRSPLKIEPPRKWVICASCQGSGQDAVASIQCTDCRGKGYKVSS